MNKGTSNNYHYDKPWARYYTLGLLMIIYCFNFIDRQLLVIMQESIKNDLHLSDTQLGLLSGFAFALFYVIAGIPIAHWADRTKRRNVISLAVAIWSIMTAVSGMAQNFIQLLAARVGVGVGEAGCSPPAHSIISDMFTKKSRATAIAFYSLGINLGILLGFLLGGWLDETLGWRKAFFIVGLPGVALAVIARFTLVEPKRGYTEDAELSAQAQNASFKEVLKLVCSRPSFILLSLGAGLAAFAGYAGANWAASFFIRVHGLSVSETGLWLSLVIGVCGGIGMVANGMIADRLATKDIRWHLWWPGLMLFLGVPFFILAFTVQDSHSALLLFCVPVFFSNAYLGSGIALAHRLVGIRMRAVSSALFFFVLNIIGLGMGPWIIGMVSDMLTPSLQTESIRYALLYVVPPVTVICSLCFWLASRHINKDLERAPS